MNTTDAEVRARVTEIIRDRLNADVPSAETDLIESGLLDSLALVMLIAALEEVFACELLLDDFDLERFRSVERIAAYLQVCGIVTARTGCGGRLERSPEPLSHGSSPRVRSL